MSEKVCQNCASFIHNTNECMAYMRPVQPIGEGAGTIIPKELQQTGCAAYEVF